MSRFYGQVFGASESPATRRGHRDITASVQSWNGSVQTSLYYNDKDELCVNVGASETSSAYGSTLFNGTFSEFKDKLGNVR